MPGRSRTPLIALIFAWIAISGASSNALAGDLYRNFDELKRAHREGSDFVIRVVNRGGPATTLAIHGGKIEPHTLELAQELAGEDLDLYTFEAKVPGLHITSSHFDEPRAVALARNGRRCISIHGFIEKDVPGDPDVCVGGGSETLRQKTAAGLRALGLRIEEPCQRLPGVHEKNVVNLCREGGVQLEMSQAVREKLVADRALRTRWIEALRKAVLR